MVYGMSASGSVLLSDISDALNESVTKANTIDRLSRHLMKTAQAGIMMKALSRCIRGYGGSRILTDYV
jgi:hypothetical protein